jgi:hypothetical protein
MVAAGMAPSAEAIERELRQADLNADGVISLRERLHMWMLAQRAWPRPSAAARRRISPACPE